MTTSTEGNGKSDLVRFSRSSKVWTLTEEMQRVERDRARDRALIDNLMNGGRPYTPEEVKKYSITWNVNWHGGKRIIGDGNRQVNNALLHPGTLFTCQTEDAPLEKRDEYNFKFTELLHEPLQHGRSGRRHQWLGLNQNASTVMHGVGAIIWANDFDLFAKFVALEDLLIPTNTYCDFSNMRYFAVNNYLTPGELVDMTQAEKSDRGWNKKIVREILNALSKDLYASDDNIDWVDRPEAAVEVHKQNRGLYYSDAVPKVKLRTFYFQDVDTRKWYRRIILRERIGPVMPDLPDTDFVYNGHDTVFADHIEHILNVQYADASLVPPLMYHSVRGLGTDLYAPIEATNRLQCEFMEHVFEQLKMYFKIQDPADRDRVKHVLLQKFGFIPEGLSIVRRDERHQIDASLVELAQGYLRQNLQENSSSFVQDQAGKADKQMTAREAMIRLNQANVMVSGMLQMLYSQKAFYYHEILRRACRKNSGDPVVKEFQRKVVEAGIPPRLLDAARWKITPEKVLGGGDLSTAQTEANWLLQNSPRYAPQAQQKILRLATATMTNNYGLAEMLVPETPVTATSGALAAESRFGSLMQGVELSLIEAVEQPDYVASLLRMAVTKLQFIMQTDGVGTQQEVVGLAAVLADAQKHIQIIAQNEENAQLVKVLMDVIGKIGNELKGLAQRQQEAMEAAQPDGTDPKAAAAVQADIMKADVKARLAEMAGLLKLEQKQQAHEQRMAQDMQRAELENQLRVSEAEADAVSKGIETAGRMMQPGGGEEA